MSNAIQALDTNIFYSLCEWGRANIAAWGYKIADSWRVSPDIKDSWLSVITRIMIDAPLWRYAGPTTGWNDPDMLEVGNGHLSPNQEMYHFTMWSILKVTIYNCFRVALTCFHRLRLSSGMIFVKLVHRIHLIKC
jgi:alpha-galactosidase